MSETPDKKIHFQVKYGPNGTFALNVFANDVPELEGHLTELGSRAELLTAIAETIQATATVVTKFPETTVMADDPRAKKCAHGQAMTFRSGEKNGKKWSGWFCNVKHDPQLPECKPEFDR